MWPSAWAFNTPCFATAIPPHKNENLNYSSFASEEYSAFKMRTDWNRDRNWLSKSTIIEKDFVFKPILTNISYNHYLFESSSKKRSTIWISFRVRTVLTSKRNWGKNVVCPKQTEYFQHTAISFLCRHNPFMNEETLHENLMTIQLGNCREIKDWQYKNV